MHRLIHTQFWLLLLIGFTLGFDAGAAAKAPGRQDWQQMRSVIAAQLDAFKRDDDVTAFSLAAPSIRSQFRTPSNFMQMVRTGYSAVYRPRSVRFLKQLMVMGRPVQPLEIVAHNDVVTVAYYLMDQQRDGSWRIAGCSLKDSAGVAV